MKQHEGDETGCFRRRLGRQQRPHETSQTDGFGAQVGSHERTASRRDVAFIENQIYHCEDRIQSRRKLTRSRHGVRDSRISNLVLRPNEALGHRRGRYKECAGDLIGFETAESPQRKRNLRFKSYRGMATGKNQSKPIVRDVARIDFRRGGRRFDFRSVRFEFLR